MSYQSSPNKSDLSDDPLVKRIQESLDGLTIPLGRALGSKLALAATNEANVRKIPVNAMFTIIYVLCGVLMSGVTISSKSYICSVVFFFINLGPNGSNKTGVTDTIAYYLGKICKPLKILAQDYQSQIEHGVKVLEKQIPTVSDSSTIQHLAQMLSVTPVLINKDEAGTLKRLSDRDPSTKYTFMEWFNGASYWSDQNKTTETIVPLPRASMVVNDHTSCVISNLRDSALTINGFNARFLYIPLRPNLEPCLESSESPQGPEERGIGRGYVLNVFLALASITLIDVGDYAPRDNDAVQMMIKGLQDADEALCDSPDSNELARREYLSLDFLGSHENVHKDVCQYDAITERKAKNARNLAVIKKQNLAERDQDRYSPEYKQHHIGSLPEPLVAAGALKPIGIACDHPAVSAIVAELQVAARSQMRGDQTPNDVAAFLGKQNTQFLRMLGVATLLRVAIDLLESLMPTPQLAEDDAMTEDDEKELTHESQSERLAMLFPRDDIKGKNLNQRQTNVLLIGVAQAFHRQGINHSPHGVGTSRNGPSGAVYMTWGEGTQHEMEINAKNVLQATAEDARRVVSIMAFHQLTVETLLDHGGSSGSSGGADQASSEQGGLTVTSISNTVTTFLSLLGVTHQISSMTGMQLRGKNNSALNHTADVLKAMSASGIFAFTWTGAGAQLKIYASKKKVPDSDEGKEAFRIALTAITAGKMSVEQYENAANNVPTKLSIGFKSYVKSVGHAGSEKHGDRVSILKLNNYTLTRDLSDTFQFGDEDGDSVSKRIPQPSPGGVVNLQPSWQHEQQRHDASPPPPTQIRSPDDDDDSSIICPMNLSEDDSTQYSNYSQNSTSSSEGSSSGDAKRTRNST